MNLKLVDVTEANFWDVIKLKSDEDQVKPTGEVEEGHRPEPIYCLEV